MLCKLNGLIRTANSMNQICLTHELNESIYENLHLYLLTIITGP